MNDTQFNSLNRAYQDAYTNYQNSLNGLGKNLTADQRTQQMEMLQNKFNDRFNQNVNSTLTDPGVRSRFEQLNRQYMGLSNFNNPAIQKQLNLTPQQLNQIRQLSTSIRSQESNANPSLNQSQLYSQTWDQLNSILTPQQQQTWSQLTGERFDFGGNAGASGNVQSSVSNGFPGTSGTNGNGTVIGNGDPKNNLTAPRPGSGDAPFGTTPGTNGTGTNPGNTGGANGNAASRRSRGSDGHRGFDEWHRNWQHWFDDRQWFVVEIASSLSPAGPQYQAKRRPHLGRVGRVVGGVPGSRERRLFLRTSVNESLS